MSQKYVLIGNVKYPFDKMTDIINIEQAKKEFSDHFYLGTSSVIYVDGKEHLLEHPFRFFKSQGIKIKCNPEQVEKIKALSKLIDGAPEIDTNNPPQKMINF